MLLLLLSLLLCLMPKFIRRLHLAEYSFFILTPDRWQSNTLILSANEDQNSRNQSFRLLFGDKWQLKTLFLSVFDPRPSIVKSVFDCHLSGVLLVTNDFETLMDMR